MAQSANDFQLPPAPTPTNTPTVEGPADDSGIIPVGPRATPTRAAPDAAPTPAPAPTATLPSVLTPTPTPTGSPARAPSPQSTSQPVVQQTRPTSRPTPAAPTARRTPQPLPARTLAPLEEEAAQPNNTPVVDPSAPEAAPTTIAPESQTAAQTAPITDATQTATASAMPDWLIWALGAAAALLALLLGLAWWRRKADVAPAEVMAAPAKTAIAEPEELAPETAAIAGAPADLKLKLEIEQLSRSMMMITLKCRVTLANRSDKAARGVTIAADLVSANRGLPVEAQVATATAFLPEIGEAGRIGPHKTQSFPSTITLPVQQLAAFKHGNKPMFVPLVRVRMDTKDAEPEFHTFVVGIAADPSLTASTKLHPVPLDGIPGSYENARARRIDNPT